MQQIMSSGCFWHREQYSLFQLFLSCSYGDHSLVWQSGVSFTVSILQLRKNVLFSHESRFKGLMYYQLLIGPIHYCSMH